MGFIRKSLVCGHGRKKNPQTVSRMRTIVSIQLLLLDIRLRQELLRIFTPQTVLQKIVYRFRPLMFNTRIGRVTNSGSRGSETAVIVIWGDCTLHTEDWHSWNPVISDDFSRWRNIKSGFWSQQDST